MNLNQVTVPSLNLSVSVPFYQKLGLKLIVEALPHYTRFECPDGQSTFSIHKTEELPSAPGVYVYFECENLDETVNELIENGITFDENPTDKRWLWREARLKDPDGNQLILSYGSVYRKIYILPFLLLIITFNGGFMRHECLNFKTIQVFTLTLFLLTTAIYNCRRLN